MNSTLRNVARQFVCFASIAMLSAVDLGGCIANEEEMAAFGNEMADESEENVAEESEALTGLPTRVYMNQDFNSVGYQKGRYVLGTGINGGTCWAHEKASTSTKSNDSIARLRALFSASARPTLRTRRILPERS